MFRSLHIVIEEVNSLLHLIFIDEVIGSLLFFIRPVTCRIIFLIASETCFGLNGGWIRDKL